jgi:hypothetical protein
MDDLTAFITARLDEDEAIAKAAANRHWLTDDNIITLHPEHDGDGFMSWPTRADAQHAANHDPARVLREVAAKRAVLAWYADALDASKLFKEKLGTGTHMATAAESYLNVMRGYAAVWSDHPDYKQEWET